MEIVVIRLEFFLITFVIMSVSILLIHKLSQLLGFELKYRSLLLCAAMALIVNFAALTISSSLTRNHFLLMIGLVLASAAFVTYYNEYLLRHGAAAPSAAGDTAAIAAADEAPADQTPADQKELLPAKASVTPKLAEPALPKPEPADTKPTAAEKHTAGHLAEAIAERIPPAPAALNKKAKRRHSHTRHKRAAEAHTAPKQETADSTVQTMEPKAAVQAAASPEPAKSRQPAPAKPAAVKPAAVSQSKPAKKEAAVKAKAKKAPAAAAPWQKNAAHPAVKPVARRQRHTIPAGEKNRHVVPLPVSAAAGPAEFHAPAVLVKTVAEIVHEDMENDRLLKLTAAIAKLGSLDDILDYAFSQKNRHNYSNAIFAYKRALARYQEDAYAPFIIIELGNIYKENGAYEEAIRTYTHAFSLPAVEGSDAVREEFTKNLAYLRIVEYILSQHNAPRTPFNKISPEILKEIEAAFQSQRKQKSVS